MDSDREKWDKMYESGDYCSGFADILKRFVTPTSSRKRALDIASGEGVNTCYLVELGYAVDAVDISSVALNRLAEVSGVTPVRADLDTYEISEGCYDLVLQVKYCGRHLFPQMVEALKPGGMLIMETFMRDPDSGELTFPYRRDYLLRTNELLGAFAALRVLFYEERSAPGNDGSDAWKATFVGVKPKVIV